MLRHARTITRRTAMLGVAVGAAAATFGCSRNDGALRFWAIGREGEVAGELAADFMRRNPGIRIEVQKMPLTAAHEKLLTAYAGEALPDVCQVGNTWLAEFDALGALEPLDSFVTGSGFPIGDYFPAILDSNRLGRRLVGIPWYVDTRLLFCRMDMLNDAGFDAAPTSWDEWREVMAAIKKNVGPRRYSILLPTNEYDQIMVLGLQQRAGMLRDNDRYGNFRSPDFHRALSFYDEIFAREWAPRMTNTQISNVWDEFGNGLYAFYMSGPWNIAEFKQRLPARLQNAWMTAPVPGPEGPGMSNAGGSSLVIFRTSRLKEQAWKFIEYLSDVDTQRRFYQQTGDIPPRVATWDSPELVNSPYSRAFRVQLDRVRSPPRVPEWERICFEMRIAQERVVLGASTVEQAAIDLDRKADAILEKRRWMMDKEARA